jgi:archaemetzincin
MRRTLLVLAVLLLQCAGWSEEPVRVKVALQPLGKVSGELLAMTTRALEKRYAVEVEILHAKDLPAVAYFRPRERYRADKLLDWLALQTDAKFVKVIGLTAVDISTTKGEHLDWGIFGLGQLGGRTCVVSTFRLGRKVPAAKLLDRLDKVAGHEIGHTFGLPHCATPHCLMSDAEGKIATVDAEPGNLCEQCRALIIAK